MLKKDKYYSEEQKEIRSFIKILVILVAILLVLYALTVKVFDKKKKMARTNNEGKVQYDEIIVGELLNKPDLEYYVLVISREDVDNAYLINKAASYKSSDKSLPLYTVDLSLEFNKSYVAKESSYKEETVEDIKFKGATLVKVKGKKIVKFIEDPLLIDKELS